MLMTLTESMLCQSDLTLAIGLPSGGEWIILLVLGLLIFGRRLPEVGRSLGRGIIEFKKGIKGIEEDIEDESSKTSIRPAQSLRTELPHSAASEDMGDRKSYATAEPRARQE